MQKYTKPINLNGAELLRELNTAGVVVNKSPELDGDNNLWLDIFPQDEDKAKSIVLAHNGTQIAPDNAVTKAAAQAKLLALGLTTDDLKALGLGGNE